MLEIRPVNTGSRVLESATSARRTAVVLRAGFVRLEWFDCRWNQHTATQCMPGILVWMASNTLSVSLYLSFKPPASPAAEKVSICSA